MSTNAGFIRGTENRDNLLIGDKHFTDTAILDENQDLVRGAVLGRKTANKRVILSDDGAADGSENPEVVLLDKTATTGVGETLEVSVLVFGQVNEEQLSFGGTHDAASVKLPLKQNGVYTLPSSPG